MVAVEAVDELFGVVFEEFEGFRLVDFHACPERFEVHVVVPFFDDGTALEAFDEGFCVADFEDDDPFDLDVFGDEFGLGEGAGQAVEEEELLRGVVAVGGDKAVDVVVPDFNGRFVGDEEAFAGVFLDDLAGRRLGGKAAEDVA